MPHQIPFTVVFASGEEERHPASELNRHEPTVRGWQSARGCKYPQELVLRLQRPSAIRRVQVLAHQCLIPERIELWVGTEDSWRGGTTPGAAGSSHNGHSHGDGEVDAGDADVDRDRDEADADATPFQYLGFITLSENQGTGFKSRELKSVSVPPCAGSFLKLRLHRNHPNQYNRYNQVGLIAVNILGDETDAVTASNGKLSSPASDGPGGPDLVYDDLAFQMYVDQDAAKIIRDMETRKAAAVQDERFEYARKLKAAQAQLHAAGERLARMTLDKRAAIAAEDFGRARTLKATIDELRERLYKELAVDDLLEREGPVRKNDEAPDEESVDGREAAPPGPEVSAIPEARAAPASPLHCGLRRSTATPSPPRGNSSRASSGLPRPVVNPPAKEAPPAVRGGGGGTCTPTAAQRRRMKSAPATPVSALGSAASASAASAGSCTPTARSSYEAYEERALPALRHGPAPEPDHSDRPRSRLNERERKQAALPISVFGVEMVEKFYSKHFADKEEGLRRLRTELCDTRATPQPNKRARAAIFLLHRALRDKVFSVYSLAAEVIRLFFTHFVPDRVSPAEVGRSVDRLLPELLLKSGDSTPRIHNMAVHTILSMADVEQVRSLNVIPATLTRPLQAATHPRLALSRLEMVEQLILSHGISQPGTGGSRASGTAGHAAGHGHGHSQGQGGSGMTCRTLAELGAQGLQHPAEPVRKVAERILVLVYRVNPRLVRKQLPPDDDITRRNLLYRQLFTDFDAIDVQRKREMQERQRGESSGSGSPAPRVRQPGGLGLGGQPASMSASWHQGQVGGLVSGLAGLSPAPSPRPGLRRHAAAMSSSMSASMCASWANGGKASSSSSSGASSLASPTEAAAALPPTGGRVPDGDADVKACDFCGAVSESFAADEGLNSHYWRACPLLTRCNECQQVVEVACLATHLTEECELRALYRRCGGCTEAVPLQRMQLHVSSCVPLGAQSRRCQLCHTDVKDADAAWRAHLMGPAAKLCSAHPRPKHARGVRAMAPSAP